MPPTDPQRVLDDISQEHVRPNLNLLPGILAAIEKREHALKPARKWRRSPASAVVLLLALFILAAILTAPGVARAVRSLFGYIPGVGRVEQGISLRTLTAPVSDSRDGYTLTVESAFLDDNRTVITYRATGVFPRWDDPGQRPEMCRGLPVLRLPDNTVLAYSGGEGGSSEVESTWKLIFDSLPADVNQAILVIPCLPELPAGEGPQEWTFALEFEPAPLTLTVFPVIDQPTFTLPNGDEPVESQAATEPALHGIYWNLDGIALLADGYYLETTLARPPDPQAHEMMIYPDALHLFDAAGQKAAVRQVSDEGSFQPAEHLSMPLNLQTSALSNPGPARLTLDYVGVSRFASASFSFDVGSEPQPGQIWPIHQDLDLDGHHLRVISAKYVETPPGAPAMMLVEMESNSGIISVIASDLEHETLDTGGSPASDQGLIQVGWHYRGSFPQGTVTVIISMITERVDGPWTIEWSPPPGAVTPAPVSPTAMPTLRQEQALCPSGPLLDTALHELPAGLGGQIAYAQLNDEHQQLFIANLDGSGVIAFGPGAFPNLSPDGQQVVYIGLDEGTHVLNLASGVDRLLPNSLHPGVHDVWPMWSPDGSQIAFYRVTGSHDMDLYVMDADGSSLRALTSGPEVEILINWSRDGTGLYYRTIRAGSHSVRLLDLETGESREIARLPDVTLAAILSPDETEMLFLTEQTLWLDRLDGSPARPLLATNGHFANQIHPLWSPDGRWVTVNYWESPDAQPRLALLDVNGCQLVHLPNFPGHWLADWVE